MRFSYTRFPFYLRLLFAGLLPILLSYAWLALYSYPQGDDFSYTWKRHRLSSWAFQAGEYKSWDGRYATHLYDAIGYSIPDLARDYPFLIAGGLITQLAAWIAFIFVLAGSRYSLMACAGIATLLLIVSLQIVPGPSETYYWFCGSTNYQIPFATFLLQLAMLYRLFTIPNSSLLRPAFLSAIVLTVLVCGAVEGLMAADTVMLMVGCLAAFLHKHPCRRQLWMLVLIAMACALIVAMAPGNAVRMGHYSPIDRFSKALLYASIPTWQVLNDFILGVWPWALAASCLVVGRYSGIRPAQWHWRMPLTLLLLPLMAVGMVWIFAFVYIYGMGHALQPMRVLNINQEILLLGWLAGVCASAVLICQRYPAATGRVAALCAGKDNVLVTGMACICLLVSYAHPRYRQALNDLAIGPAYRMAHLQWDRQLKQAQKTHAPSPVTLCAVPQQPFHLYYWDAGEDPRNWKNRFMSSYYHIRAIKVRDNCIEQ